MDTPILASKPTFNKAQASIIRFAAWGMVAGFVFNIIAIALQGSGPASLNVYEGPFPTKQELADFFPRSSAICYSLSLLIYVPSVACMVSLYQQLGASISSGLMAVGVPIFAITYSSALGIMALVPYLSQDLDDSVFYSLYLVAFQFGGLASNMFAFMLPVLPLIVSSYEVPDLATPKWVLGSAIGSVLVTLGGVITLISAPANAGVFDFLALLPLFIGLVAAPWWVLNVALPRVS